MRIFGGGNARGSVCAWVSCAISDKGRRALCVHVVRAHTGKHVSASNTAVTLTANRFPEGPFPFFAHRENSSSGVRKLPSRSPSPTGLTPTGHRPKGLSTPLTSLASLAKISRQRSAPAYCSRSSILPGVRGPAKATRARQCHDRSAFRRINLAK